MSENDLRTLMGDAVEGAPAREFSTPVIASAAAARTRRRRAWYGVGALGAASAVAVVAAVSISALGAESPKVPVASGSTSAPPVTDPGAISLPTSLPLGELVAVVNGALPSGTSVAELPMDAAFAPDGTITLPLTDGSGASELSLTTAGGTCTATSAALDAAALDAISSAVCAAAAQYPNAPGTVIDGGTIDPAA
ncbi:MAG: hypothetical protein AB7V23_16990 [Candidatus Nanopelagicales bacterium]